MGNKYLMSIDEGTMSSRASVIDLKGNILGSSGADYGILNPNPGWYEQDSNLMVEVIYNACQGAIKKSGINPKDIAAVSLSSQGGPLTPVDKNNRPLRPSIGWQDSRGAVLLDEIAQKIPPEKLYKISGAPLGTVWTLSKLLWFKKFEPEIYEKTVCLAHHQDYFLTALGVDKHYEDISSAARFGFFDVDHHKYSQELLKLFDIPEEKLPIIVDGGTQVGNITKSVSQATGIPEGTPVCVGAMDVTCAVLGLGITREKMAATILGPYGTCISLSSKPVRDPSGSMVVSGNTGTNWWTVEGSVLAAASSYRWYRDTFCDLEVAAGKLLKTDPFELINQQAASEKPGAKGLLYMPHLASAGAPRNNPNAKGLFLGLTFSHTKADLARAVMEGISLEIRDIITAKARMGIEVNQIRLTGGGSKSPVWNQIQADVYGRTVQTVQTAETASVGAAMLAAVGTGIYKNIQEAADEMVRVTRTYEPNPANNQIYGDLYDIYCSTYESLASPEHNVYKKVNDLQNKLGL